jgi:hypothetical protein
MTYLLFVLFLFLFPVSPSHNVARDGQRYWRVASLLLQCFFSFQKMFLLMYQTHRVFSSYSMADNALVDEPPVDERE